MSSRTRPWYKFDPRDWREGVKGIPAEERSLYLEVLNELYMAGRPVNWDPAYFAVQAGLKPRQAPFLLTRLIGRGKLEYTLDGELTNARFEREMEALGGLSAKRADAGKASGEARRARTSVHEPPRELELNPPTKSPRNLGDNGGDNAEIIGGSEQGMAENSHPRQTSVEQTGAYTRGRARASDRDRDREDKTISSSSTPTPREKIDACQTLTSRIMRRAAMARPPYDLPLVSSWLEIADEQLIFETVDHLCERARGPVGSMSYFDKTIRDRAGAAAAAEALADEEHRRKMARMDREDADYEREMREWWANERRTGAEIAARRAAREAGQEARTLQ